MRFRRKRQMGASCAINRIIDGLDVVGHSGHRGGRFAGAAETPKALNQNNIQALP